MNAVDDDDEGDDGAWAGSTNTVRAREQEYISAIVFVPIMSPTRYVSFKGTCTSDDTLASNEECVESRVTLLFFKTAASCKWFAWLPSPAAASMAACKAPIEPQTTTSSTSNCRVETRKLCDSARPLPSGTTAKPAEVTCCHGRRSRTRIDEERFGPKDERGNSAVTDGASATTGTCSDADVEEVEDSCGESFNSESRVVSSNAAAARAPDAQSAGYITGISFLPKPSNISPEDKVSRDTVWKRLHFSAALAGEERILYRISRSLSDGDVASAVVCSPRLTPAASCDEALPLLGNLCAAPHLT